MIAAGRWAVPVDGDSCSGRASKQRCRARSLRRGQDRLPWGRAHRTLARGLYAPYTGPGALLWFWYCLPHTTFPCSSRLTLPL